MNWEESLAIVFDIPVVVIYDILFTLANDLQRLIKLQEDDLENPTINKEFITLPKRMLDQLPKGQNMFLLSMVLQNLGAAYLKRKSGTGSKILS
jgi:hypothetical protein